MLFRSGLHEVALVVHMETVIDRVTLEVGHETGDIDDCHERPFCFRQRCELDGSEATVQAR